jgi:hypothetical protein
MLVKRTKKLLLQAVYRSLAMHHPVVESCFCLCLLRAHVSQNLLLYFIVSSFFFMLMLIDILAAKIHACNTITLVPSPQTTSVVIGIRLTFIAVTLLSRSCQRSVVTPASIHRGQACNNTRMDSSGRLDGMITTIQAIFGLDSIHCAWRGGGASGTETMKTCGKIVFVLRLLTTASRACAIL